MWQKTSHYSLTQSKTLFCQKSGGFMQSRGFMMVVIMELCTVLVHTVLMCTDH